MTEEELKEIRAYAELVPTLLKEGIAYRKRIAELEALLQKTIDIHTRDPAWLNVLYGSYIVEALTEELVDECEATLNNSAPVKPDDKDKRIAELEGVLREIKEFAFGSMGGGGVSDFSNYEHIALKAYKAVPGSAERDECEVCNGKNGGVRGNENIIDGKKMCDKCSFDYWDHSMESKKVGPERKNNA